MQYTSDRAPKVLVLMASYNPPFGINNQVESIYDQKGVEIKLIISDDNSSSKSVQNLNHVLGKFPDLQIIFRKKQSGSAGQNFFSLFRDVDISGYDYVSFSDQDDIWDKHKLCRATSILNTDGAFGYSASTLAVWSNGKKIILRQSSKITKTDYLFEGAGQGCTFVLKADFFRKVQQFCIKNENSIKDFYYHDWLVYLLCRVWGMKWYFDDLATMSYMQHDNNDTGARAGIGAILKRFKLISSGWYKYQIILATNIAILAGGSSDELFKFDHFMNNQQTIISRILNAKLFFKFGRRKLSDKVVLFVLCILGFI